MRTRRTSGSGSKEQNQRSKVDLLYLLDQTELQATLNKRNTHESSKVRSWASPVKSV